MRRAFSCAITVFSELVGQQLYCWGDNGRGQLGRGTVGGDSHSAVEVPIPSETGGAMGGRVANGTDDSPVGRVSVDLFTTDVNGTRTEYLRSTTTGGDGRYEFPTTRKVAVLPWS